MSDLRMLRTAIALVAAALLPMCGGDRSEPVRVRSGDVEIAAAVAPRDSRVGKNELVVELRDAQDQPIDGAHVEVEVRMPAMGAMAPMGGPATVEPAGNGAYRARYDIAMGGTWQVTVRSHLPNGNTAAAEGSLTIGTPGLRLEPVAGGDGARSEPRTAAHDATDGAPQASEGAEGAGARSEPKANEGHEARASGPSPARSSDRHPAEFRIDPSRLKQIGIRSEPAQRADMTASIRAVGRVTWDETTLHDVTTRVAGFAGDVVADELGAPVTRGQVLFQLYSPDLYAAQREYLEALRSNAAARNSSAPERARGMAGAAERRLRLWGVEPSDIAAIARDGAPREYLPIRAPIAGYVVEKELVAGSAVAMGQRVYRIAPLDRVWIEAEVYEAELGQVTVGMPATIELPYLPGRRIEATVARVLPSLQPDRRTARVRLALANPEGALRPDMYATVSLATPMGPRLTVPDTAVLRAGEKSFVFLDLGEGRLRPLRVEIGATRDGRVEILAGLDEGQRVVVAGTFLVSAESRLRAALESW